MILISTEEWVPSIKVPIIFIDNLAPDSILSILIDGYNGLTLMKDGSSELSARIPEYVN